MVCVCRDGCNGPTIIDESGANRAGNTDFIDSALWLRRSGLTFFLWFLRSHRFCTKDPHGICVSSRQENAILGSKRADTMLDLVLSKNRHVWGGEGKS